MKKVIALLISLSIVLGLCSAIAVAGSLEPDLSYAVASDLHYNIPDEELEWFS